MLLRRCYTPEVLLRIRRHNCHSIGGHALKPCSCKQCAVLTLQPVEKARPRHTALSLRTPSSAAALQWATRRRSRWRYGKSNGWAPELQVLASFVVVSSYSAQVWSLTQSYIAEVLFGGAVQLIKALEEARGNGTSMISLIIPPRDQV